MILLLSLSFISAVPQIVTTNFNLTIWSNQSGNITEGNYKILGEGGQLTNGFGVTGNCSFNYNLNNIPLIFSRDFEKNDTDLAVLIKWINNNKNATEQWKDCILNLSICANDVGYKGNYTEKVAELDICYRARDAYSTQITSLNDQIANLTTWRNFGVGAGIGGVLVAFWLYRKQNVKKAENYYDSVPSGVAQR